MCEALIQLGYERVEALGGGGMGEVYKAFDPRLKRWVAVKQIRPDQVSSEGRARFRIEAEALARLAHPHIVKVYDFKETDAGPLLVMEYVAGGTLESRLGHQPLEPAEAARLVAILAWAVHAAHEKGIVHRDLKPANVLLDDPVPGNAGNVLGGYPKVTDFGLATLATESSGLTVPGLILGTPAYMSPEQAAGRTREVGPPSDVWALGVILYRCLTRALPFAGESVLDTLEQIRTRRFRPLRERRADVPATLEAIFLRCLEADPADRLTAAELASALEGTSRVRPAVRPTRQRLWAVAGGLLAAGVLMVAGWAIVRERPASVDSVAPEAPAAEPVRVSRLNVLHYKPMGAGDRLVGALGRESFAARFDDKVVIEVELSRPGHCYLIGFNFDGKEQLLWPCDENGFGDPGRPPERQARLRYPPTQALGLNDDPAGGWQAFVAVALSEPLPGYAEWRQRRGPMPWRHLPPGQGVWASDGRAVEPLVPNEGRVRGSVVPLKGLPPLLELCRWARGGESAMVEAVAFPVKRMGDE